MKKLVQEGNCINLYITSYNNSVETKTLQKYFRDFVIRIERFKEYTLTYCLEKNTSDVYEKFTEEKFCNAFEALKEGEAYGFQINAYSENLTSYGVRGGDIAAICLSLDHNRGIAQFFVGFHNEFLKNLYTQAEIIQLFQELSVEMNAVTGLIETMDSLWFGINDLPMEREAGIHYVEYCECFSTKLRGYGFANLLTKKHIEIMGGVERIEREAPCAKIRVIKIKGEPAIYLQLSENIWQENTDAKIQLKRYLTPLLYPLDLYGIIRRKKQNELLKKRFKGQGFCIVEEQLPKNLDSMNMLLKRDLYSVGLCVTNDEAEKLKCLDSLSFEEVEALYKVYLQEKKNNLDYKKTRGERKILEKQHTEYRDVFLEITEDAYPEALPITIEFERITVKKKKAFERIITAWALTALNNGFSNEGAHDISGLMWENNRCCFQCDLGSGFEEILDALQRMLNWFCKTENLKVRLFTTQSFDKLE